MTEHLISPVKTIAVGGREFTLSGTFETLRNIAHAFAEDLIPLQARILDMRVDEIAKLLAAATGGKETDIGQHLLDEADITGIDYQLLKAELMAWLLLAMTPKKDREKKAQELVALIDGLKSNTSPGSNIAGGASASSAGRRKRSGRAPSGT